MKRLGKRLGNGVGSVYRLSGKRSKPWAARKTTGFNEKGQPKYKFIGYYRTKAEAMAALMEYNKSPYSLNGESLCDVYERFIVGYEKNHKPRTVMAIKSKWKHLTPLYDEPVSKLTRKSLQVFFDNLNASEMVKIKVKQVIKAVLNYSIRYDIIPPERISMLKYIDLSSQVVNDKREKKVFTPEEIDRLKSMNDDMSKLVLFLIYTGLRAGEYVNLTDEDIDADMVLHIRDSKTEAGVREVPLSDKAQKLAPLPQFATYNKLYYRFSVWREKHEFDHELHDTRHTLVSLLTEKKVDERIIRSVVGHKGTGVTENVYTHISNEIKRDALNLI